MVGILFADTGTAGPVLGVHKIPYVKVAPVPPVSTGAVHAAFTVPDAPVLTVNIGLVGAPGAVKGGGLGTGVGTGIGSGTGSGDDVTGGSLITPFPPGRKLNSGDRPGAEGVGLDGVGLDGVGLEGGGLKGNVFSGTLT